MCEVECGVTAVKSSKKLNVMCSNVLVVEITVQDGTVVKTRLES